MSWINKAKGLIWEDDGSAAQAPVVQATPAPTVQSTQNQPSAMIQPATPWPRSGEVNPEMVADILGSTLATETPFTKLFASAKALADVIPDEGMRIRAAHKMAGASSQAVLDALQMHLTQVDLANANFKKTAEQRKDSELIGLRQKIASANSQISDAQAEIERANARIQEMTALVTKLKAEGETLANTAATRSAEIDGTVQQFANAAAAVQTDLLKFKESISTFVSKEN